MVIPVTLQFNHINEITGIRQLSLLRVETAVMSLNIQIAMQLYEEGQLHATRRVHLTDGPTPCIHLTCAKTNAHQHYCIAIQHGEN